jgi:hypothetical protein
MSQGNKDNSPPTLRRESTNGGDQDGNNSLKDPCSAAVLSLSPKDLKMAFDREWNLTVGTFEEEKIKWLAEKKDPGGSYCSARERSREVKALY